MKLSRDIKGACKIYTGARGEAVITKNMGNRDKTDRWSVAVTINGVYKKLANRVDFNKAYVIAENEIG